MKKNNRKEITIQVKECIVATPQIKEAYTEYTFIRANSLAEKELLKIEPVGNLYRGVTWNEHKKIVARIDNKLYNFPAVIGDFGTAEKIKKALQINSRKNAQWLTKYKKHRGVFGFEKNDTLKKRLFRLIGW